MIAESMILPMMKPEKIRLILLPKSSRWLAAEGLNAATTIFFACAWNVSFDQRM